MDDRLMRRRRCGQTKEILWMDMNEPAARAVNVRDKQKRDGYDQRQNHKKYAADSGDSRSIANQQIAANRDQRH